MNIVRGLINPVAGMRSIALTLLVVGVLCPLQAMAQVPPRFYWKTLSGGERRATHLRVDQRQHESVRRLRTWSRRAQFRRHDGAGGLRAHLHPVRSFGHGGSPAAHGAALGRSGQRTGTPPASRSADSATRPSSSTSTCIGPKAQKTIPDALRYEPGFSLDVLVDLAIPIGEYDSSQPLNIGQNRWYGRIGFPIVWQLGDWVPGRRTTLEFLPAVWLFGNNNDFGGRTLETDPLYQIDAHLTRDFTNHLWGSLDAAWFNGGKATIDGVKGQKLDNYGFGLTLGYQLNDNMGLTFSYKSTVSDQAPDDLQMDVFMVSLVYGWHPIIEGAKRLQSE